MKRQLNFAAKGRKKIIRGLFQAFVLLVLFSMTVRALFTFQKYMPYETAGIEASAQSPGFIALSYFGVDLDGSDTLISTKQLDAHLGTLHAAGYVTITIQDILDYYRGEKALPEKALFLMFEDGRRDTVIFAQKLLEKYNYSAAVMTYAQKLEEKDGKFLTAKELRKLKKSTFWEIGTNGYRLEYINVFDRYGEYLGEMDARTFSQISDYLDRDYDHYLMDYIRDESGRPKESKQDMEEHLRNDYEKIRAVYQELLGETPQAHVLMHGNTGRFGSNPDASAVNEAEIKSSFSLNFNREGGPLNTLEHSIFDLTRMQPQGYWSANHLMMRVWDATRQPVSFVRGDEKQAAKWTLQNGAAEFRGDEIYLTSMPSGTGVLRLNGAQALQDIEVSVRLKGNRFGSQSIVLRANEAENAYISVQLRNNRLRVTESLNGVEKVLLDLDLDIHDGVKRQTIGENRAEAIDTEIRNGLRSPDESNPPADLAGQETRDYIPPIELGERGNRLIDLSLAGGTLTVLVDGRPAAENLSVGNLNAGAFYLVSAPGGEGYSHRNISDNVYDGIFQSLTIHMAEDGKLLYSNQLRGMDRLVSGFQDAVGAVVNWFIKNL